MGSVLSLEVLRARFSPREAAPASAPRWALPELCGRLVELCGSGAPFSLAMALVRDAQVRGEPAAWVTSQDRSFYPPDAQDCGVDLAALPVVRVPAEATARAADALLRSGAFGLAVVDLGATPLPAPLQSRLLSLARLHQSAVVFLTERPADTPSLGPLISLRAEAVRARSPEGFSCALRVLKDKQRPPVWTHVEVCRGPPGLR